MEEKQTTQNTPQAANSLPGGKRRWLQFRLRTSLILLTLVALGLWAWRVIVRPFHVQASALNQLKGVWQTEDGDSGLLRWVVGEKKFNYVTGLDITDSDSHSVNLRLIPHMLRLRTLAVGGKGFDDEDLVHLHDIKTLEHLVLDSTRVTDQGIEALRQAIPGIKVYREKHRHLVALQQLAVEGSRIRFYPGRPRMAVVSGVISVDRRVPQRISIAHLQHRLFLREALETIAEFDRLESLTAGHNTDDELFEPILRLKNLHHLRLQYSQVTGKTIAQLKDQKRLRMLMLGPNIYDEDMKHVAQIKSLVYLNLSGTQVGDAGLAHLTDMPNLTKIELCSRPITRAGLKSLLTLPALRELYLTGCERLTREDFLMLGKVKTLNFLELRNTKADQAIRNALFMQLPQSRIAVTHSPY